jgi:integrase/recombinase XerD
MSDPKERSRRFWPPRPESFLTLERALPPARHPAYIYLAGLPSPASERAMRRSLERVAELIGLPFEHLKWWGLTYTHLWSIREHLLELYRPTTVRQSQSALRGVLEVALEMGLLAPGAYEAAVAVPLVPLVAPTRARTPSKREIARLIAAARRDAGPKGTRDAALLSLLAYAGLKRSEVTGLRLADVSPRTSKLTVGKRIIPLGERERGFLSAWIRVRGRSHGALFQPMNKGGRIARHVMSGQAVAQVVAEWAAKARLGKLSPEDLRRASSP